jgi:hypothetical protein
MGSGYPNIEQSDHFIPNFSMTDHLLFNNWVFENIRPYLRGRVLEIDSRSGLMSALFIENNIPVHLSDPNKNNRENLQKHYKENPNFKKVHNLDPNSSDFENLHSNKFSLIDTVILTNVIEHGFYNEKAIQNATKFLPLRGRIAIIIPAQTTLYSQDEENSELMIKYNSKSIRSLLSPELEPIMITYCKFITAMLIVARKI